MGYGVNARPHWAKEWEALGFGGMDARVYLKRVAYKEQIQEFRGNVRGNWGEAGVGTKGAAEEDFEQVVGRDHLWGVSLWQPWC